MKELTCHRRLLVIWAASGMILQNHRRLPECIFFVKIAALGYLKQEGFLVLVSNFKGASINFEFYFFINQETKTEESSSKL